MKLIKILLISFVFSIYSVHADEQSVEQNDELQALIKSDLELAQSQYKSLLNKARANSTARLPRSFVNGINTFVEYSDWTSGFFPGSHWYLYEYTHDEEWKAAAIEFSKIAEPAKLLKSHHDVGFILNSSFGNGYRLGVDQDHYRDVLLTGATTLITRFNPKVGAIKSWDNHSQWAYPVIIDNMMNLELLTFAAKLSKDPYYKELAIKHADTTLANHFRSDSSSYHVINYDPSTGSVISKQTHQGYSDSSAWARGQAWGLYGYTMMYRETKEVRYKEQAERIASFLINNPKMPNDKVPFWDLNDPSVPNAPRDSSAAAIMSSELELSQFVDKDLRDSYIDFAKRQIRTLSNQYFLAKPGENGGFILKHATGHKPNNSEVDVPLNYGDYYYLEALLRLQKILNH